MNEQKIDYFTVEVIHRALEAMGQEMFTILQRTAHSPLIFETLDFAVAATDASGELVCMGNGVTGFMGTVDMAVKDVLRKWAAHIHEGDVFILNDPFGGGGSHLSDVTLVMPVFWRGEIVAHVVNKAHWSEVGGMEPGSVTTNSIEIFQEGLQFPNIKLFARGQLNDALVEMIRANVRMPDMTIGDMWAGIAALRTGLARLEALLGKYGRETVIVAMQRLLDYGEQMARRALKQLPRGTFTSTDWIDSDGLGHGPFEIKVAVTINENEFICDFTGTHPQVRGSINTSAVNLASRSRAVYRAVTVPHIPTNGGMYRPLKVICPPGTLFSAAHPAAVSTYYESAVMALDLIWKALAPHIPERLTAGSLASTAAITLTGVHRESGQFWLLFGPFVGGWGAGFDHDGGRGQFSAANGETFNIPVEITEARYGISVEQYAFHDEPGGYGRFNGGRGVITDYRITSNEAWLSVGVGRHKFPPWGVDGGHDGTCSYVKVIRSDGREEVYGKASRIPLKRGELVRHVTAAGGGWGDPCSRDPAHVKDDIKNGFITATQAATIHGWIHGADD